MVVVAKASTCVAGMTGTRVTEPGACRGTTKSTADRLRLTLETVVPLLAASQRATLLLEVGHADSWEGRCCVVLSSVLMDLVDGHGGMDNMGLNGLCVIVSNGNVQSAIL